MAVTRASEVVREWLESGTKSEPRNQKLLAAQISRLVGRKVSQATVSNIQSGKSFPRNDITIALEQILGIPHPWWLERIDPSSARADDADDDLDADDVDDADADADETRTTTAA